MRCFILLPTLLLFITGCVSYKQLHKKAVLVDTHNDILTACFEHGYSFDQNLKGKTHSDVARLKEGGMDVQIFSIWCDGNKKNPFAYANQQIDTLMATIARNSSQMILVKNSNELQTALQQNKIASMMGVEGGHMIEDKLENLDALYNRGVRYMTLTWNNSTSWATSALLETTKKDSLAKSHKGLTDFGKKVVKRMNELGMIVDVSHVGEQTFWDVMNSTTHPVIASHSCVYSLCPVFRNLKDDQIKAIGKNGGVIHLNFFSGFIDPKFDERRKAFNQNHKAERDSLLKLNPEPYFADDKLFTKYATEVNAIRPPLSALLNHLDYIVKLVGVDHVGMGSDFDGIPSTPQGLDDVTNYSLITKELLQRGYSKKDIKKILGENFLRVLSAVQRR